MSKQNDESDPWEAARLIPVFGVRSAEEQERRATSALLAVLSSVEEFGSAFSSPFGAHKGKLDSFIEPSFELEDGKSVRPDGLIRVKRGKRTWVALVEVKTGKNLLKQDQIETYLDVAREQAFDCVITISNQIAKIPGEHPVDVDKRKTRKVALYHISWSRVLTEAILQKSHRGVADPDQAWILGELIRYLEHPAAGAIDFSDMGEHWVAVRDAVQHGTLRQGDKHAVEVAGKWEELVTFAAIRLGRRLGADVQEVLSSKERRDISVRISNIVDSMVDTGVLSGAIRIPNTVSDVSINADLRSQQILATVTVDAPDSGRPSTRVNWLLRQLKSSPPDLRLDSRAHRSRTSMSDLLENVRQNPALLTPDDNRDITSFTVSMIRPMGLKRTAGKRSFIDSVLDTIDEFYAAVVQEVREWRPRAPRLDEAPSEVESTEPVAPSTPNENDHQSPAPANGDNPTAGS